MRTQTVHVTHDFAKPPERIFAHLSEHENLGPLFNAKVTRLADGEDGQRNGVGSKRGLQIAPLLPGFEETVTEFVPNERIVYTITKGTPLNEHLGTQVFTPTANGGTHLDYTIRMGSPVPFLTLLVKQVLQRSIKASMPKADEAA